MRKTNRSGRGGCHRPVGDDAPDLFSKQLRQRDEVWRADVRSKITQGMDSIRAGRTIPAEQVKREMAGFKKKWIKNRDRQ